jgi:GMP synthase (glutamine-hydrolysing)
VKVLVIETQQLVPIGTLGPPLLDAGLELVYWRTAEEPPPRSLSGFAGVIALGGGANPDEDERYPWLSDERELLAGAVEWRLPTLGLCLGAELLAQVLDARPFRLLGPQIGWFEIAHAEGARGDALCARLPRRFHGFGWHRYGFGLPTGATLIAGDELAAEAFSWGGCVWASTTSKLKQGRSRSS